LWHHYKLHTTTDAGKSNNPLLLLLTLVIHCLAGLEGRALATETYNTKHTTHNIHTGFSAAGAGAGAAAGAVQAALTVMRALKAGSLPSLSTASQPSMLPLTA
jgi:hypothetical protein